MSKPFPQTAEFSGTLYTPSRVEAEVFDLEIEGTLPASIHGAFYQVAPDPQYPPMLGNDIFFNGDGMVTGFYFADGQVSMRRRYVMTERLQAQRREGRSLNGVYRNTYTNDPLAAPNNTTANTTVMPHNGVLLALKEDALPWAMDLHTLETLGEWDFDGQITSATFTAHPKVDPRNGNLCAFSYEARGDGTPDMAYFELSADGKLLHEIWFQAPYAAMVHDFAVTEHYVIFPLIPLTVDVERMQRGGPHFQWQPDLPQLFAVLPRDGSAEDVRWFKGPVDSFQGHTLNAFDEGGKVYLDMPVTGGNVFYFFPQADGYLPPPESLAANLMRWTFDLNGSEEQVQPQPLTDYPCEFPRCDERFLGRPYQHGFVLALDPERPYNPDVGPMPFQFFNLLAHVNLEAGTTDAWFPGDSHCFQEPIFIPRSPDAPEADGYVLALLNVLTEDRTELVVLDSRDMHSGPIARIKVPFRLRMSLHGCWAPAKP
ncbi:carotenoid oxygenase family protein [Pseudomonas sp. MAFF 302030]|jgi:carotenoid cleavage dioxygenase-like enzyme|uniref:Carotenoid oxygenase family protein n=1 Tax=Pseudomonas morbosilactucae TaxID=2938197 RepID=A0A9X1YXI9_9PSED|nr:carotenoid oxygenase family protein [Pseudomonas morbosilactucae]MCK9799469.1 carotenoid oxygenase family protein [Pseudomonas morbosilactucae]WEK07736.1 MAG: carotenoid oxygenase family protein [Pseudomonas sp.]